MKRVKVLQLDSVVWKEGRFFVAQCLNIDIASDGKTKKEALGNLQEALGLYFQDMPKKSAHRIEKPQLSKITVQYA